MIRRMPTTTPLSRPRPGRGAAPAPRDRRSLLSGRLTVFAAIVLSAFTLRLAVTSLTPLLGTIGDDLDFGSAVAGVLGMVPTAMFALAGILTPLLARRLSLQVVTLLAMGLATIGLLGRALYGTSTLLLLSAVALIGMGIGNVVVPPLVKRYFPDRIATMSTLYITVLQTGTMLPPMVAVPLADAAGWRVSLGVWAILSALAVLPWLRVTSRDRRVRRSAEIPVPASVQTHTTGKARRSPVAWGLAAMFGMTSLNTYAMLTWLPGIVTDAGYSIAFGGTMVALFAAIGLVSGFAAPTLASRLVNPFPVVLASIACFLVGYTGLLVAPGAATIIWVLLTGLGPTTFPLALTLINLRSRTPGGSAALSGFTQGVGYTVACIGPVAVGAMHSATGGWGLSFGFLYATLAVLGVGGYVACRPRLLEDSW